MNPARGRGRGRGRGEEFEMGCEEVVNCRSIDDTNYYCQNTNKMAPGTPSIVHGGLLRLIRKLSKRNLDILIGSMIRRPTMTSRVESVPLPPKTPPPPLTPDAISFVTY
jgi:hypothetical protein